MITNDKLAHMLCRLFWLVTQTPGVATYADDVELFTEVEMELGTVTRKEGLALIEQYYKEEK